MSRGLATMDSGLSQKQSMARSSSRFELEFRYESGPGLEPISPGSCKLIHVDFERRRLLSRENNRRATICRSLLVYWSFVVKRAALSSIQVEYPDMCNYSTQPQPQPQPQQAPSFSDAEPLLAAEVPDHPACTEALALARSSLPASILNHSFRVFLYARRALLHPGPTAPAVPPTAPHVLFVACILHDIGVADAHASEPERFEVAGANVAAALLKRHGVDAQAAREAWLAVAMHTSPHVAEGAGGLVRALRLGVRADFGSYAGLEAGVLGEAEGRLPRLGVEKELGDAVVRQAVGLPSKAPGASWPRDLVRAKEAEPEREGVNKAF